MRVWRTCRRAASVTEVLIVIAILGILAALLLPAVQAARAAARRTQCLNNLRFIGLAMLLYVDDHSLFPPGNLTGVEGKAFAGPMVRILPYADHQTLYDRVNQVQSPRDLSNETVRNTRVAWYLCSENRSRGPNNSYDWVAGSGPAVMLPAKGQTKPVPNGSFSRIESYSGRHRRWNVADVDELREYRESAAAVCRVGCDRVRPH